MPLLSLSEYMAAQDENSRESRSLAQRHLRKHHADEKAIRQLGPMDILAYGCQIRNDSMQPLQPFKIADLPATDLNQA